MTKVDLLAENITMKAENIKIMEILLKAHYSLLRHEAKLKIQKKQTRELLNKYQR
jgi:hypothetical protein